MSTRWSIREEIFFTKRLGLLLRGGMTLTNSLAALTASGGNETVYRELISKIGHGFTLSYALKSKGELLPTFIITILEIGERSGRLSESLLRASEILEKRYALRKQTLGALLYPLLIAFTSACVVGIVLGFVIPKIAPALLAMKTTLPLTTQVLLWMSDTILEWWWLLIILAIAIIICAVLIMGRTNARRNIVKICLRAPLVRKLIQAPLASHALRSLGILLSSGIPLPTALQILATIDAHSPWQQAFSYARTEVEMGRQFSQAKAVALLCPAYIHGLIISAEQSGTLSSSLLTAADWLEQDSAEDLRRALSLLEPILLLLLGIFVALIATAIIVPIYGFTNTIVK